MIIPLSTHSKDLPVADLYLGMGEILVNIQGTFTPAWNCRQHTINLKMAKGGEFG